VQFGYYSRVTNDYIQGSGSPYIAKSGQLNSFSAEDYSYFRNAGSQLAVSDK
jgi:hypothetical protein